MSFLKSIFGKKDEPITNYTDFWNWFQKNEKDFYHVVKSRKDIEKKFFDKIAPKLDQIKDGILYLTGMYDDNTAELVLTADGTIKNILFVEELVEHAPKMPGWRFTALKPALDIADVGIEMAGYKFNSSNMSFYSNDHPDYPDEIDIVVIHSDMNEDNAQQIISGTYIFLDNYLGELESVINIDNLKVKGPTDASKELIPIEKLKDYLIWRQKEFVEKYDGVRYNTANDEYSVLEAKLKNGTALIATVNTHLLNWDRKASHPWIATITIKYAGSKNNGMPNNRDYEALNKIEEDLMQELADKDGYLNIGRQTANSEREIYFACKDFRKPSKLFFQVQNQFAGKFAIEYDIYKDKYWQSFEHFNKN